MKTKIYRKDKPKKLKSDKLVYLKDEGVKVYSNKAAKYSKYSLYKRG